MITGSSGVTAQGSASLSISRLGETTSVSYTHLREVLDVMLDLAAQGRTMIIVTHEMQFARAVADRIVFIDGGKIVEDSDPDTFFEAPKTDRARQFLNIFEFNAIKPRGTAEEAQEHEN